MGGVCRARNCFRSKEKCPDLPFFTFPKNPISAKKWITNIGDPELLKRPPSALKNNVVCALHFEEKCFVNKKKRTLVRNAVPTIFNIPPLRTEESQKNDKYSTSERADVPECNSGAVFSCKVETFDNWHQQIDAVTEQLLCLLPENSSHTSQLEPQTGKRCVDAYTQYENESDSREFENRLNDLNKDTSVESSDAVPRVQLLCRLCSKLTHRESVMPIFSYEAEKIHLEVMINSILPTKLVQDDGLPQQVCNLCVRKLAFCHDVRKEFLASDKRLRDLLGIAAVEDFAEMSVTKDNVETLMEKRRRERESAKERTKRYREKLKNNPGKYEEMRRRERERYKKRASEGKKKEQSITLENPSTENTSPAEDTKKVQLKENEPPLIAVKTEETPDTQSENLKRGSRKRKNVMTAVKNRNTRKKDNKIPKLTKSGPHRKKTTADEDIPQLIKSTPQGRKTIAEEVPKLIKPAPHGKKATTEETLKLIKAGPLGKKSAEEETPKVAKTGPHGKKAATEETPKLVKAGTTGTHGKKATTEETPKLMKTGSHGKKASPEEISKLVKTGPHGKKTAVEDTPKLIKAGPHRKMTTTEETPKLVKTGPHGKVTTNEEIANLAKPGPHENKTAAEESDFENDSNYEIHWYDEAYDDSISEDMGTSDSILNNKKMLATNVKKQLTSEAEKLVTDPIRDEEMKSIEASNITKLNHKMLNESEVDGSMAKDTHVNDSKLNENQVNDSNINEINANTGISVLITNSHPSPKEGNLSSVPVRQKIGSGSVKVRLMTERQKLLKLKMKTQNKLLKQGSRKKVLTAKNSCSECKKSFSSKLKLERHILMHSKFECAVCSTIFNTAEELSSHSRENCLAKLKAVTDAAATGHECEICRRTFKTRQRLLLHSKTHSTVITHSAIIPYTCKVCPKAFPTRIRLKQHLKSHTPEKSFKCSICNESFKNNKALFQHRAQHPENSVTLKCETCNTFFTSAKEFEKHREEHASSSLTTHVNGASTAEITSDTHNADKLGSGLNSSVDPTSVVADVQSVELTKAVKEDGIMKVKVPHLEKNLIITSADQFVCDICDCKFSSKHFQEEHKKAHHSLPEQSTVSVATSPVESTAELLQTPERGKLYFCDQCGEGYERKRSLALHRYSHTSSHRCPHCHQSFSAEVSLTRHLENCVEVKEETTERNNQL